MVAPSGSAMPGRRLVSTSTEKRMTAAYARRGLPGDRGWSAPVRNHSELPSWAMGPHARTRNAWEACDSASPGPYL
jgi:hypothetical protein